MLKSINSKSMVKSIFEKIDFLRLHQFLKKLIF